MTTEDLPTLLGRVRACRVCVDLPLGPRPVVSVGRGARIVLIGQAPGTKVHASGIPWHDPSGDHLREWLQIPAEVFYDPEQVAILPMSLCYPGKKKGGDAPPRPECAPLWHEALLSHLPDDRLLVLIGQYAQKAYLGKRRQRTLTDTVAAWRTYLPEAFVAPHPSWRSRQWMKKQPWFEAEALPELRRQVAARL